MGEDVCGISFYLCVLLQFVCGLSLCCGRTAHLSREDIQAVVNNYRNPVRTHANETKF